MDGALNECLAKMQAAGCAAETITAFEQAFLMLSAGNLGLIPEQTLSSAPDPQSLNDVTAPDDQAHEALSRTAIIKLNGGLGTTMRLSGAKSLLLARDDKTLLDITVMQVLAARQRYGVQLPLIFMDSFRTSRETLTRLSQYEGLMVDGLPLDFLQAMVPRVYADTLLPARWPADPSLEWCPPGHGDLYPALVRTGLLNQLLDCGYEYLFVSNGDNLGAVPCAEVAGWFAASGAVFGMEVCRRIPSDRKGGHLALRRRDGKLIVRESAQVSVADAAHAADIDRYRWFNTNSVWLDLRRLVKQLPTWKSAFALPLIVNKKPIDPNVPGAPMVYQLESALGAGIELFDSVVVEVGRERFIPVKSNEDLELLRSGQYRLLPDATLRVVGAPVVEN